MVHLRNAEVGRKALGLGHRAREVVGQNVLARMEMCVAFKSHIDSSIIIRHEYACTPTRKGGDGRCIRQVFALS